MNLLNVSIFPYLFILCLIVRIKYFLLLSIFQVLVVQSPSPSLQIKEPPPSPGSPASETTMYTTTGGATQIYMQVSVKWIKFFPWFYIHNRRWIQCRSIIIYYHHHRNISVTISFCVCCVWCLSLFSWIGICSCSLFISIS